MSDFSDISRPSSKLKAGQELDSTSNKTLTRNSKRPISSFVSGNGPNKTSSKKLKSSSVSGRLPESPDTPLTARTDIVTKDSAKSAKSRRQNRRTSDISLRSKRSINSNSATSSVSSGPVTRSRKYLLEGSQVGETPSRQRTSSSSSSESISSSTHPDYNKPKDSIELTTAAKTSKGSRLATFEGVKRKRGRPNKSGSDIFKIPRPPTNLKSNRLTRSTRVNTQRSAKTVALNNIETVSFVESQDSDSSTGEPPIQKPRTGKAIASKASKKTFQTAVLIDTCGYNSDNIEQLDSNHPSVTFRNKLGEKASTSHHSDKLENNFEESDPLESRIEASVSPPSRRHSFRRSSFKSNRSRGNSCGGESTAGISAAYRKKLELNSKLEAEKSASTAHSPGTSSGRPFKGSKEPARRASQRSAKTGDPKNSGCTSTSPTRQQSTDNPPSSVHSTTSPGRLQQPRRSLGILPADSDPLANSGVSGSSTGTSPTSGSPASPGGSGGTLLGRIGDLADHFPEVKLTGLRRLTRAFSRSLSGANQDDSIQASSATETSSSSGLNLRPAGSNPSLASGGLSTSYHSAGSGGAIFRGKRRAPSFRKKSSKETSSGGGLSKSSSGHSLLHLVSAPILGSFTPGSEPPGGQPIGGSATQVAANSTGATPSSTTNSTKDSVSTGSCISASCLGAVSSIRGSGRNSVCPDTGMNNRTNSTGESAENAASHDAAGNEHFEVSRLQALLESRGMAGHWFSALGPRMQGILQRSNNNPMGSKVQTLIAGMQQTEDESTQLQSVMEICQLLLMGNEETLGSSFPVKQCVQALMTLLQMEHNFDIMTSACRALTYIMEALPRSTSVVCDAVPLFLEKLQRIECMDVAEQSLTAIEMLSKRHSKSILCAGGIAACLTYLDFFSISAQRSALNIAANCCYHMNTEEFKFVADSLPALSQRLTMQDRKSVENVCLCFTRLVDCFQHDSARLHTIADSSTLENIKQLLIVTPPILNSSTFVGVVRMMHLLCAGCPKLAVFLLKLDIAEALRFLLLGTSDQTEDDLELVARTPQETHEIVCLIGELMPRLPTNGLFSVDVLLRRSPQLVHGDVAWQWKDEGGIWRHYTAMDCRILETAFQAREDEVSINAHGRTYTVDFHNMTQINEETGKSRQVHRKANYVNPQKSSAAATTAQPPVPDVDARTELLSEDPKVMESFVRLLFGVLYEVYSSSAGPAVRHECLMAIRRMVFHSSPELLREVLKNLSISSHIANMLNSTDLKIKVGALQLVHILLEKMPDVFSVYFRREGVMHQIERIITEPIAAPPSNSSPGSALGTPNSGELPKRASQARSLGTLTCSSAASDLDAIRGGREMAVGGLVGAPTLFGGDPALFSALQLPPPPPLFTSHSGMDSEIISDIENRTQTRFVGSVSSSNTSSTNAPSSGAISFQQLATGGGFFPGQVSRASFDYHGGASIYPNPYVELQSGKFAIPFPDSTFPKSCVATVASSTAVAKSGVITSVMGPSSTMVPPFDLMARMGLPPYPGSVATAGGHPNLYPTGVGPNVPAPLPYYARFIMPPLAAAAAAAVADSAVDSGPIGTTNESQPVPPITFNSSGSYNSYFAGLPSYVNATACAATSTHNNSMPSVQGSHVDSSLSAVTAISELQAAYAAVIAAGVSSGRKGVPSSGFGMPTPVDVTSVTTISTGSRKSSKHRTSGFEDKNNKSDSFVNATATDSNHMIESGMGGNFGASQEVTFRPNLASLFSIMPPCGVIPPPGTYDFTGAPFGASEPYLPMDTSVGPPRNDTSAELSNANREVPLLTSIEKFNNPSTTSHRKKSSSKCGSSASKIARDAPLLESMDTSVPPPAVVAEGAYAFAPNFNQPPLLGPPPSSTLNFNGEVEKPQNAGRPLNSDQSAMVTNDPVSPVVLGGGQMPAADGPVDFWSMPPPGYAGFLASGLPPAFPPLFPPPNNQSTNVVGKMTLVSKTSGSMGSNPSSTTFSTCSFGGSTMGSDSGLFSVTGPFLAGRLGGNSCGGTPMPHNLFGSLGGPPPNGFNSPVNSIADNQGAIKPAPVVCSGTGGAMDSCGVLPMELFTPGSPLYNFTMSAASAAVTSSEPLANQSSDLSANHGSSLTASLDSLGGIKKQTPPTVSGGLTAPHHSGPPPDYQPLSTDLGMPPGFIYQDGAADFPTPSMMQVPPPVASQAGGISNSSNAFAGAVSGYHGTRSWSTNVGTGTEPVTKSRGKKTSSSVVTAKGAPDGEMNFGCRPHRQINTVDNNNSIPSANSLQITPNVTKASSAGAFGASLASQGLAFVTTAGKSRSSGSKSRWRSSANPPSAVVGSGSAGGYNNCDNSNSTTAGTGRVITPVSTLLSHNNNNNNNTISSSKNSNSSNIGYSGSGGITMLTAPVTRHRAAVAAAIASSLSSAKGGDKTPSVNSGTGKTSSSRGHGSHGKSRSGHHHHHKSSTGSGPPKPVTTIPSSTTTVASRFFQSLPLPRWGRSSGSASSTATPGGPGSGLSTLSGSMGSNPFGGSVCSGASAISGAPFGGLSSPFGGMGLGGEAGGGFRMISNHHRTSAASMHQYAAMGLTGAPLGGAGAGGGPGGPYSMERFLSLPAGVLPNYSNAQNAVNKQKVRQWVREEAIKLNEKYFSGSVTGEDGTHDLSSQELSVLKRLQNVAVQLKTHETQSVISALATLAEILTNSDASPFEILHSGLVQSLHQFLTVKGDNSDTKESAALKNLRNLPAERNERLREFCCVFLNIKKDSQPGAYSLDLTTKSLLNLLVMKLNASLTQIEQFPVRVHDFPGGASGSLRGLYALKFFHTHQLKCVLRRHSSSTNLRQWKRGPVKIDPLALVSAVERYLILRGYGRVIQDEEDETTDDDGSDDDLDEYLNSATVSTGGHRIEFLINDHPLPFNITIYQAVRQFGGAQQQLQQPGGGGSNAGGGGHDTDTDSEMNSLQYAALWVSTHTIHYRLLPESEITASAATGASKAASVTASSGGSRKSPASAFKSGKNSRNDTLWNDGIVPASTSPLDYILDRPLSADLTVDDPSLDCLALMRVLHGINQYWWTLFKESLFPMYDSILALTDFQNPKLTAKANRQMQDPLVIMTGNIPTWLKQIAYACPFLLPFETRQLLLYVLAFDRDRGLQRLLDTAPDIAGPQEGNDRVTPRLDKKKVTVHREDLMKQAEAVINESSGSNAILEIHYKDEVGTGLGPTLEFYALVSKEFQKADLELWRSGSVGNKEEYLRADYGLFPAPLAHHPKPSLLNRLRSRFKFLGKFMARAVMDSRLLDIPFNPLFYRWILNYPTGGGNSVGAGSTPARPQTTSSSTSPTSNLWISIYDLYTLDPDLFRSFQHLLKFSTAKAAIEQDQSLSSTNRRAAIANLLMDGSRVEDLDLDFTLPGYPAIELRKNGKDTPVTIHNLDQFLQLTAHWMLGEGIGKTMEGFREGFESVLSLSHLKMFYPEELDQLFCGNSSAGGPWEPQALLQCTKPDHGYSHDSPQIQWMVHTMAGFDSDQQRHFVQFVTGCPKLPVGGFKSLAPPLTIVRKTMDDPLHNPDHYLPSVMTCVNYLKLPEYSSIDVLRQRLEFAMKEGQRSFHLS